MKLQLSYRDQSYNVDTTKFTDLSVPVMHQKGVRAFHLPHPEFEPFRMGSFVGATKEGGPCNCASLKFYPHGNGTHTECVGHISLEPVYINQVLKPGLKWAQLITVQAETLENGDRVVGLSSVQHLREHLPEAVMLRTMPFTKDFSKDYSGSNPTYLSKELCAFLADQNVEHLIIDQPSVDREEDGGALAAHHAFWRYPYDTRLNATITELANFPDNLQDGLFVLELQIAPISSDASPSRPIIYFPQPIEL